MELTAWERLCEFDLSSLKLTGVYSSVQSLYQDVRKTIDGYALAMALKSEVCSAHICCLEGVNHLLLCYDTVSDALEYGLRCDTLRTALRSGDQRRAEVLVGNYVQTLKERFKNFHTIAGKTFSITESFTTQRDRVNAVLAKVDDCRRAVDSVQAWLAYFKVPSTQGAVAIGSLLIGAGSVVGVVAFQLSLTTAVLLWAYVSVLLELLYLLHAGVAELKEKLDRLSAKAKEALDALIGLQAEALSHLPSLKNRVVPGIEQEIESFEREAVRLIEFDSQELCTSFDDLQARLRREKMKLCGPKSALERIESQVEEMLRDWKRDDKDLLPPNRSDIAPSKKRLFAAYNL